jgi:DNA-binding CsgD family transcriptional regulator/tetratricopeptide (TPR) repeat protein
MLVEREDQFRSLSDLLAASARTGAGATVLVGGPVASGKTALLRQFTEHAAERGALVLEAIAAPVVSSLPLGVFRQLFQNAQLPAGIQQRAAELLGGRVAGMALLPAGATDIATETGLVDLLVELAADQPLVIAIDDVAHTDALSLHCLARLVHAVGEAPALVVATMRLGSANDNEALGELVSQPGTRHLQLGPLSLAGTTALARRRLGPAEAERLAPLWHRASGGNPLLVRTLIEDHLQADREPGVDPVFGKSFGDAVVVCVRRCGDRALDVAAAAAVLDEFGTAERIASMLGMDDAAVAGTLGALSAAGLVHRGRIRHAAARAAILTEIAPNERTSLHLRAAKELHRDGGPIAAISRHLVAAGRTTSAFGVPLLLSAADQALAKDENDHAIDVLTLAGQASVNDEQRASIISRLVIAQWRVDPAAAARHLPTLLGHIRNGHMTAGVEPAVLRFSVWHGLIEDTLPAVSRLAPDGRRPPGFDFFLAWFAFFFPEAHRLLSAAETERPAEASSPVVRLLDALRVDREPDEVAPLAMAVLDGEPLTDETLEQHVVALTALTYLDRLETARAWCTSLHEEAVRRRATGWAATLAAVRADIALREGDMAAAETWAREALGATPTSTWGVVVGYPRGTLIFALTMMGKHVEAARQLLEPMPVGALSSQFGLHYLWARGQYNLATGRSYAALDDFLTCGRCMIEWGIDLPGVLAWRIDAVDACLRLGKRQEAERLLAEQFDLVGDRPSRARGQALRLAAAIRAAERIPLLREAIEVLESAGAQLELVKALFDLTEAYNEAGEPNQARLVVRRARRLARESNAETLTAMTTVGETDAGPDVPEMRTGAVDDTNALSDTERRVAMLARSGHTNREIAGKLYITVSTVEQHLTRVYRKLNIRGRSNLPVM